jgi:hypothetical protein
MSLNYQVIPVRSAAILTGTYVAGTTIEETHGENQLVLYVDFTKGSLTTAEFKIEFSPDNTNWYQETTQSITGGTATETVAAHQIGASGAYRILVPIKDRYIKVSAKGTGTVTASEMTITAVVGEV